MLPHLTVVGTMVKDSPGAGLWSEPSPGGSVTPPRDVAMTQTFIAPSDLPHRISDVHGPAAALSGATAGPPSLSECLPLSQTKDTRV